MNRLSYILLFLLPFTGNAQNYQCLQSGVKHYFTNHGGYLRGIRIDSVNTYTDSTVYYPYHTPRGRYGINPTLDSTGGSWLGKRVLQLNDGTFLFDNTWNDTVIIKTQASPGDKWVFYSDTTNLYYEAELISVDTMTVMGSVDSVKRIQITAHDPSGIVTTDLADSFQLLLGKNNGFVQAFDLYTFPYHAPDSAYSRGLDYYTDYLVSMYTSLPDWQFHLTAFINPTMKDLYQWNVGDVYEYSSCDGHFAHVSMLCSPAEHYRADTITSVSRTSTSVSYTISRLNMDYTSSYSPTVLFPPDPPFYVKYTSLDAATYDQTPLFDTTLMPEEYNQPTIYYYLPDDTGFCSKNTLYGLQYNNAIQQDQYSSFLEGVIKPSLYKAPFGLLNSLESNETIVHAQSLIYFERDGNSCGAIYYPPTKVNDIEKQTKLIDLYPNPVSNDLTITSAAPITSIDIINPLGQTLFSQKYSSNKITINTSALSAGVYLIRVNKIDMKEFIKQ